MAVFVANAEAILSLLLHVFAIFTMRWSGLCVPLARNIRWYGKSAGSSTTSIQNISVCISLLCEHHRLNTRLWIGDASECLDMFFCWLPVTKLSAFGGSLNLGSRQVHAIESYGHIFQISLWLFGSWSKGFFKTYGWCKRVECSFIPLIHYKCLPAFIREAAWFWVHSQAVDRAAKGCKSAVF